MKARHLIALATSLATAVLSVSTAAAAQSRFDSTRPDVLVVGGTPAGVAAAVAAARRHQRVTLVVAGEDLGGILTDGLMNQWDLNVTSAGTPVQRGLFAEIYGKLGDAFAPAAASDVFADMVANEANVAVRYGEVAAGVAPSEWPDGRHIDTVMVKNVSSNTMVVIRSPLVVDATDSGNIAAMAGARYDLGRQDTGIDERMQAVTEMFTLEGVRWDDVVSGYDAAKFGPGGATNRTAWGYAKLMRDYKPVLQNAVVRDLNFGRMADGSVSVNAIDIVGIDGLDPQQVEQAKRNTTVEAPHLVEFLRSHLAGFADARVGRFASSVYVRETRHIDGLERLTSSDVWNGKIPSDSVGLASYPIDVHPVDVSDQPAFASTRHVYGIPFGALVPQGIDNVILAGPAISATHEAAGSARIIPTTIEEGEAAGAAAAYANDHHLDFPQIAMNHERVAALRRDLAAKGALVGGPVLTATHPPERRKK
ncbi:MAG: FAD-dependent oxidoreductase [Candidatus Eremiobacteraeota bacterium]|nr:FAD-dependent oxidoreductase [Candidatus Eremiobacteraeota bacterium]